MQIQFSLLHLGAAVSFVAIHFFVSRTAALSNDYVTAGLVVVFLLLLGITIHRLFRLTWIQAAFVLYPVSLIWALFFGMTYSLFWNLQQRGPFHMDALGKHLPIQFAGACFEVMLILGLATSIAYGVCARIFVHLQRPSANTRNRK